MRRFPSDPRWGRRLCARIRGAIAGADFFTTEVWTWRGLRTDYAVFVIDPASRRVQIVGSTPFPNDLFMDQVVRTVTAAEEGVVGFSIIATE